MLVPLLVMYVPSVQLGLVQPVQKLALVREENFPASHAEHDLSLDEVPFAERKLPALQLRHVEQAAAFSSEENVPVPHAEHDLSLDEVPVTATKAPAVQLRHCEQAPWLDPVEKVCGPHEEHVRSEVEDPAALTKVPPPQTVQGVHLAVGGRLDSDTVKIPLRTVSLGHEEGVPWQSVPCNVLVLAEHDPVNGVTVHGLEAQVVGLT